MNEPMDVNFSLFNGHKNDADKRARELLRKTHPKLMDRVEEIEAEQNGIMGVFNVDLEPATMIFVGMVAAFVNEEHVAHLKTPKPSEIA